MRCGACGDVPGDRKRARERAVGEDGEEDRAGGEEERGRVRQRTGPAKWSRKKCEHGRRKDTCKDCGGAGICQHNREHLPGVLLVCHIVCPYMDLREEVEQVCLVYIMMCAHVQVALCMHIYTRMI